MMVWLVVIGVAVGVAIGVVLALVGRESNERPGYIESGRRRR